MGSHETTKTLRSVSALAVLCGLSAACGDGDGDGDSSRENDAGIADAAQASDARSDGSEGAADGGVITNPDIAVAPAREDGQVVAPWDSYCVATFTRDFDVIDSFFGDEPLQHFRTGDRYLIGASVFSYSVIVFITATGPAVYELEIGDEPSPFTSSCEGKATETVEGFFLDTTVYADEEMTKPLCVIQAGTIVRGYGFSSAYGGATYSIEGEGLGPLCGGITSGHVPSVHNVDAPGATVGNPYVDVRIPVQ